MARIFLNGLTRALAYVGCGGYAAYINVKTITDAAHGLFALAIAVLTIILLTLQIKKTRKDLKK